MTKLSTVSSAKQHIRYFVNENGAINGLYLQWRHLPRIAELFQVNNPTLLGNLIVGPMAGVEGYLDIPPGSLAMKENAPLLDYGIRLTIPGQSEKHFLQPDEVREIIVEIENISAYCWAISPVSNAFIGLSFHLLAEDGDLLLCWDVPRTYFLGPRAGYISFIEPSQKLICKIRIYAPRSPGRYFAQLDLAHEPFCWFSERGVQLPRLDLEVGTSELRDNYIIDNPGIVYENIGRETVIVNTHSGAYYSAAGYASLIWNAIADGYSASDIVTAFASAGVFDAEQGVVKRFIAELLAEQLIVRSEVEVTLPCRELVVEKLPEDGPPVLTKRMDTAVLAATHPVREISASAGWPHRDDATAA